MQKTGSSSETVPLKSSWLEYAKYDPAGLSLEIGFKDGRVLAYQPIYPQSFLDLKASASPGRYYLQAIKPVAAASVVKG